MQPMDENKATPQLIPLKDRFSDQQWLEARQQLSKHLLDVANDSILFSSSSALGANFVDERFDQMSLKRVNVRESKFESCSFFKAAATGSNFIACQFNNCNFNGSNFQYVDFTGSVFSSNDRDDLIQDGKSTMIGANFSGVNFSSTTLEDIKIEGCSLGNSIFSNAHIKNCDMTSSTLEGANFKGAFLENIDLNRINIEYADFLSAQFKDVVVPIMQLPYTFGGLEYLFHNDGLAVKTDNKHHSPDSTLTKNEYRELLNGLEVYFLKMCEYFPLANIYLSTKKIHEFKDIIGLGLRYYLEVGQIREIKFLCKLAKVSNTFEPYQLSKLYELIRRGAKTHWKKESFRHNYAIHLGEIENSLLDSQTDLVKIRFISSGEEAETLKFIPDLLSTLEEGLSIINSPFELRRVTLSRNSPLEVILELATAGPEYSLAILFVSIGYLLKGSSSFLSKLFKLKKIYDKGELKKLKEELKAARDQLSSMKIKMNELTISSHSEEKLLHEFSPDEREN